MLHAVPLRNAAAAGAVLADGSLNITVPVKKPWFHRPPVSWVLRIRPLRTYQLDPLGARVWELCDGTRTVEQIVDIFAEKHELTFHEARVAVTQYLRQLIEKGMVAVRLADLKAEKTA